jgi:hypothetical protein
MWRGLSRPIKTLQKQTLEGTLSAYPSARDKRKKLNGCSTPCKAGQLVR